MVGFGILFILMGILGYAAFRREEQIRSGISAIHESHHRKSSILHGIQTDTLMSCFLVRDYMLDPLQAAGIQRRKDLEALASSLEQRIAGLADLMTDEEADAFARLQREIINYRNSLNPIFAWTPEQITAPRSSFLKEQVLPRRDAILSLTNEFDKLNEAGLKHEQQHIAGARSEMRRYLRRMSVYALCFTLAVAAASFFWISRLEQHQEKERRRAESAETELRQLSLKLVKAQEDERKSISRELHDEIGQMITGIKMELGNILLLRTEPGIDFLQHVIEAKALAERTLLSLRDMAMGLRPAMLDDLGLGPALQWQAKEFSRRSGILAAVQFKGDLEGIEESARTCVYRMVQESLTNCARHANAKSITISVAVNGDRIALTIQDDGAGFDANAPNHRGLGLIGMEERIREQGGVFAVTSQINKGTTVRAEIPFKKATANV